MTRTHVDQPLKAFAWMSCSALGFSTMAIFVKRLGAVVPEFELVFFRSILNLLFVLGLMLVRREKLNLPKDRNLHLLLTFRGLVGFGGVSCLFYSIHHLPLPIAMMLGWCSPLFVILFSRIFLGERIAQTGLIAVGLALVGLFFLLDPLGLAGGAASARVLVGPVLIGIFGAAMSGAAYVAVRAATAQVGVNLIVVYFMMVSTLISAPLAIPGFRLVSSSEVFAIFMVGISAAIGQVAMTHGYRYAPASRVSTMSLLNAAFSAFFGWWLFNEQLASLQWGGLVILATGIAFLTWSKK